MLLLVFLKKISSRNFCWSYQCSIFHAKSFQRLEFPQILILSDVFDIRPRLFFKLFSDLFLSTQQKCLKIKQNNVTGIISRIVWYYDLFNHLFALIEKRKLAATAILHSARSGGRLRKRGKHANRANLA